MMEIANLLPPQTFDSDPVFDFEADLEEAAHALDLEPWVLQRLKHPEREITVNIPLVRHDGSAVNLTGYRIQHSRAHGPCLGPVMISPHAHTASLRTTACEITLQSALLGLRLGGAAGAIVVDPDQLTESDLRHVMKDYVVALHENTGPLRDVLTCDGNDYIATWMEEANTHARGQSEPAAIVGRCDESGSLGLAWARATAALIRQSLATNTMQDVRIAVQGCGRRGRALATILHAEGAKLVAVADRSGGLVNEAGIDLAGLEDHLARNSVVFGFPAAAAASNSDVLETKCDVLVLAAAERQIGGHNAARIRARTVFELAPRAIAQSGASALPASCTVVPHLLASAAQLPVWFHEWQRGLNYSAPDPHAAQVEATAAVEHAFERARRLASDRGISLRQAALMLAMSRLASTLRLR